jgi:hypothetical protein
MLRRVALLRIEVSEECIASIIRVTRICEIGAKLAVTGNDNFVPGWPILVTLMMETILSSEMSVHTRTTRRQMPEDGVLQNILFRERSPWC